MPRKDVPYGGAICSLKERIAELFDLVGEKLHSINGVQGDGRGDVKIVSGDPAVVIAGDAAQNEIEIALDKSKLPSAMVTSVNGESGPVFLKARDIPSDGHSNVQDDIDSSRTSIIALAGDIIIERQTRQKTDAALQTNINRVQTSMPEAAAAAVSNNPTVARLASDVPNKVDKITGGSIKRAYTHTGSVQDDTPAVNGTDANSIGLRDANGRMQAADPAAGATDKTLVTANWVSQTGNSAPNNLVHKTGNETKSGTMTFTDAIYGRLIYPLYEEYNGTLPSGKYRIFARIPAANTNSMIVIDVMVSANGANFGYGRMIVGNPSTTNWFCNWVLRKSGGFLSATSIQIAKEVATGDLVILALNPVYTGLSISLVYSKVGPSIHEPVRITKVTGSADYALDGSDADLTNIIPGSDM